MEASPDRIGTFAGSIWTNRIGDVSERDVYPGVELHSKRRLAVKFLSSSSANGQLKASKADACTPARKNRREGESLRLVQLPGRQSPRELCVSTQLSRCVLKF